MRVADGKLLKPKRCNKSESSGDEGDYRNITDSNQIPLQHVNSWGNLSLGKLPSVSCL